jgi:hypothetical protein
MRKKLNLEDALKYAHEDLLETSEYRFKTDDGRILIGKKTKTACGHWFSSCEDDPAYNPALWRFNRPDYRPTCPSCVEKMPYEYPGMLLVVRDGLGIQIVQVTGEDTWEGVYGIGKGRIVQAEGKDVVHVCQDGDIFEDIGMEVKGGALVHVGGHTEHLK